MTEKQRNIVKKAARAGGWQVFRRGARMLPFGGTLVVITLVGSDIRRKGLVKGVINSGLDAIPVVGLVKNGYEMFKGDIISDKPNRKKNNGRIK
ncbi:MAG TPA: hypothetical protein PKD24_17145 [Pyrinomonadaceae bacterium]|nr:hypothetical protein [Pyrinomonadaceae bacterium]HMP66726.1 hypothetical protein [Pyrinomonadaceae bacterium]